MGGKIRNIVRVFIPRSVPDFSDRSRFIKNKLQMVWDVSDRLISVAIASSCVMWCIYFIIADTYHTNTIQYHEHHGRLENNEIPGFPDIWKPPACMRLDHLARTKNLNQTCTSYLPCEHSREVLSTGGVWILSFIQYFSQFVEIHSYVSVSEIWQIKASIVYLSWQSGFQSSVEVISQLLWFALLHWGKTALSAGYMYLLRALIGSLDCLAPLWLVGVITLVLVLRYSGANRSMKKLVNQVTAFFSAF